MELILNLGWSLVAIAMICGWLRFASREAGIRRMQAVTLAVAILILLPAISISDDLVAAQNPAEVVSTIRRDYDDSGPHSVVPTASALPVPIFSGLRVAVVTMAAPSHLSAPIANHAGLESIQNRPPPTA